ncbi:MAG: hypothetical protein SGI77_06585 [Pirellulaceae bacterium]|nr:hypothetical protein [Pirellulaceae bacterium]
MKLQNLLFASTLLLFANPVLFAADDVAKAVEVNPSDAPAKKSAGTPIENLKSSVRPLNVTVDVNNNTPIAGTLVEVDVLLIKTAFGEASVPLSEIAGIRFPQGDDVSTSVVMLNGDSITGATDVRMITVDTDWGTAKVNGSSVRSILFVPNLAWTSSPGISGKRWALQDAAKAQAVAVAPNPAVKSGNRTNVAPPPLQSGNNFNFGNNRSGFNPQ